MKKIIGVAIRFMLAAKLAYGRKWSFLGVFAAIFFGSVAVLGRFDLLPDIAPAQAVRPVAFNVTTSQIIAELPTKIEIPKINLSTVIVNPTTTDISVLDGELLKGAVRYPTSAKLGEIGNVVLFGHSSYLPVVGNKAYKAFNDIQKLTAGDTITVYSSDNEYSYRVRSVAKESVNNSGIQLSVTGRVLTLSTCDSFGEATDRFVVTADFVESGAIFD